MRFGRSARTNHLPYPVSTALPPSPFLHPQPQRNSPTNDTTTARTPASPVFTVPDGSIVVGHDGSRDSNTALAAPALMLVVGPRGLGGFTGLLLGSVSGQCVQLATCPVLVVPTSQHDTPDDRSHADHSHADQSH